MASISNAKFVAFIKAVASDFNYLKAEIAKLSGRSTGVSESRVIELVKQTNASSGVVSNSTISSLSSRVSALENADVLDYAAVYQAAKNGTELDAEGQPVTRA